MSCQIECLNGRRNAAALGQFCEIYEEAAGAHSMYKEKLRI
jgi:hypothetical protein